MCLFPAHRTYCDLFGGDISVLMAKPSSMVDVYNDQDADLVNLFRVIRDKRLFGQLREQLELTLFSREEMALSLEQCADKVERARRFVVRHWQGRNGTWAYSVDQSNRGKASSVARWHRVLTHLESLHKRVSSVQIERGRWQTVAERYDSEHTLFFLDTLHAQIDAGLADERTLEGVPTRADQLRIHFWERVFTTMSTLAGMAVVRTHDDSLNEALQKSCWIKPLPERSESSALWFSPKAYFAREQQIHSAPQQSLF